MVVMCADYRPSPFGGWIAALCLEGHGPARGAHFPDPHAAYHGIVELVGVLEEELGSPIATVHTLRGDSRAWDRLVSEHGFEGCAGNR